MCTDIYMPNGDEIGSRRGLKRYITKILYIEDYHFGMWDPEDDGDDFCLCSVDIRATAKANGYRCIPDGFSGDVFFVKKGHRCRKPTPQQLARAQRR